jgi:hypothetical protein
MGGHEDARPEYAIWSLIQRFAAWKRPERRRNSTLKRMLELYSAPINPTFTFSGNVHPSRANSPAPAHPSGIPGAAVPSIWRRIMLENGGPWARYTTNTGNRASRRRRLDGMRRVWQSGDPAGWRRLSGGELGRRMSYTICRAEEGNPIPGFDTFGAADLFENRRTFGGRRQPMVDISGTESLTERQRMVRQVIRDNTNMRTRRGHWRPEGRLERNEEAVIRFRRGGNYFGYRTILRQDDEVWIEFEGNDSRAKSTSEGRRSAVEVAAEIAAETGGPVPTREGLVLPEDDAGGDPGMSTVDRFTVLPPEDIEALLSAWAGRMEDRLNDLVGG